MENDMTLERYIRLIAGTFILASLHWLSSYWYLFTAFVGANLFQSALTGWCLMEDILRALGVRSASKENVVASEQRPR
jgi:hypothetical protein